MSWASYCPLELRHRPVGVVSLAGLDTTYNAVHKIIWDLFSNNRKQDRVPLRFSIHDIGHEFPKCKPKRSSYEWYIPKGILRQNWMKKHLEEIPSLVIAFFDLDWDDSHWQERLKECSTRLQIIRTSLDKRSTKIAVVLIQKSPPLPHGEDNLAAERAASFCTECELAPKALFVLPHTDQLEGYIIRLEGVFQELSVSYYTANARRVKGHRDYLNRTNHQLLFIRHQFKLGFFNEMKQDPQAAIKHYKNAYGHCLETKVHDTNILEVKTIAGFISYKISSLCFLMNAPLDAIGQFRRHVDEFKSKIGPADLLFEHYAWLSLQFELFGDLFDLAIRSGLSAIQTQHPGWYYHQSALHAIKRKQLCIGLCHPHQTSYNIESMIKGMEFYGQRPWRAGNQSLEIDSEKEAEGIRALHNLETNFVHSLKIIHLLNSSVEQFYRHKSSRMISHLMVLIGEEKYKSKEYQEAQKILQDSAIAYRNERWYCLLTTVLTTSLRCAFLSADLPQYITYSLELLAPSITRSVETKSRILVDLLQVICLYNKLIDVADSGILNLPEFTCTAGEMLNGGQVPDPEPGCDTEASQSALSIWTQKVSDTSFSEFRIDLGSVLSFIECKVELEDEKCSVDKPLQLKLFVRCMAQFSVRFSRLAVIFNQEELNSSCILSDGGDLMAVIEEEGETPNGLLFVPGNIKQFDFTINLPSDFMGKTLEVTHIELSWLHHLKVCLEVPISLPTQPERSVLSKDPWVEIPLRQTTDVACRRSDLELTGSHNPSVLMNELFPVTWTLHSKEEKTITNLRLVCSVDQEDETASCMLGLNSDQMSSEELSVKMNDLDTDQKTSQMISIRTTSATNITISAKCLYELQGDENKEQYLQTAKMVLPVVGPFAVYTKYLTTKMVETETVTLGEPFLLQFHITNQSGTAIQIKSAALQLAEHFNPKDNAPLPQLDDCSLEPQDTATELQKLVTSSAASDGVDIGTYKVAWRRCSDLESEPTLSLITLPVVKVETQPIYIECELPGYATLYQPFTLAYQVHNRTAFVQEFNVSIDRTDQFMMTGYKSLSFRTLPYSDHSLRFIAYPLQAGRHKLPLLQLEMTNQRYGNIGQLVKKLLPEQIYVMPST